MTPGDGGDGALDDAWSVSSLSTLTASRPNLPTSRSSLFPGLGRPAAMSNTYDRYNAADVASPGAVGSSNPFGMMRSIGGMAFSAETVETARRLLEINCDQVTHDMLTSITTVIDWILMLCYAMVAFNGIYVCICGLC